VRNDDIFSNSPQSAKTMTAALRALPTGIWAMGFGSLFMDMSSELIHSLLPVFMAHSKLLWSVGS
jgi:hypothetical protein